MHGAVTVLIPTHDGREQVLMRAVASVWRQTCQPAKIVIQKDWDGDGAAATRNRGLERVDTEWVAFLDSDDEFYPNHLFSCVDAAGNTGADLVYPYGDYSDLGRDPLATLHHGRVVSPLGVPFGSEQEWWLRNRGGFIPVTVLARTELVRRVGGFPNQNEFELPATNISGDCEELGLWIRMLDAGAKFHHVPVVTWKYHVDGSNTGGNPSKVSVSPVQQLGG